MKGITLWQPWATLMATGAKKIETRGWATNYRGPIAIHAAKRNLVENWNLCWEEPFKSALDQAGALTADGGVRLHYGCILAVGYLVLVQLIGADRMWLYANGKLIAGSDMMLPGEPERSFGDYSQGRYAWNIVEIRALPEPIPCRGYQRLWDVPAELERRLLDAYYNRMGR
jgi:hypothetical protein